MSSGLDSIPKRGHRIVGIDMARSLAIFLMVIENYKNAMDAHGAGPRWLVWFFSHIEGRAAPAFVTIMGVGLALLAHKALESEDSAALRRDSTSRVIKRGIFLVVVGVFHYQLWPGDILHFYGFYMALCALVLFRPSWTPLAAAGAVMVVAYVINQTFNDEIGWENGYIWYNGYLTLSGFIRNTFLNGYHPVFPWTAYALVGMWLARRPIFEREGRPRYLLVFIPITLVFEFALSFPGFLHFFRQPDTGMAFADGMLRLMTVKPYPLIMLARQLTAISAILVCLELADRFRKSHIIETLAATGRMSLTHYLDEISPGARDTAPPTRDVVPRVLDRLREERNRPGNPLMVLTLSYASLAVMVLAYHIITQDAFRPLLLAAFREASAVLP